MLPEASSGQARHLSGQRTETPIIYKSLSCLQWKDEDLAFPDQVRDKLCYSWQLEALYSVLLSLKKYLCFIKDGIRGRKFSFD